MATMPELGEVEIVRQNLERWWVDEAASEVVLHDPELVTKGDAERVDELLRTTCESVQRRGKYLFARFAGGDYLVFHFRMTGKITCENSSDPEYVRLAWQVPAGWLTFKDSRRLGQVEVVESESFADYEPIAKLGPEPHDLDGSTLRERVNGRKLKNALLDQTVVAGVGNIAISEVFFAEKLPPDASGDELDDEGWESLAHALPEFFDSLIQDQKSDEIIYLNQGKAENPFSVYKREDEPCPRCGVQIQRKKVAGRSSYFCPNCQA